MHLTLHPGAAGTSAFQWRVCWWLCMVVFHLLAWLHTFGTSKEVYIFWANSLWSAWLGIDVSSSHQDGICTCLACHFIHSMACRGGGSGSLCGDGGGVRLALAGVGGHLPPGHPLGGYSPPRSSWRWDYSGGGTQDPNPPQPQDCPSLFPWSQPIGLFVWHLLSPPHWQGQLVGHICLNVTFELSSGEGALPSAKVTCHFCLGDWFILEQCPLGIKLPGMSFEI